MEKYTRPTFLFVFLFLSTNAYCWTCDPENYLPHDKWERSADIAHVKIVQGSLSDDRNGRQAIEFEIEIVESFKGNLKNKDILWSRPNNTSGITLGAEYVIFLREGSEVTHCDGFIGITGGWPHQFETSLIEALRWWRDNPNKPLKDRP